MRNQDWAECLAEFLNQSHFFDWAKCNCVLFSADGVKAQTGIDYAKAYRNIKTKRGMLTKLGREYDGDVAKAATAMLGDPINVRMAKRGDVVAALINGENVLGICIGKMSVFISENEGLIHIHTAKCINAWAI